MVAACANNRGGSARGPMCVYRPGGVSSVSIAIKVWGLGDGSNSVGSHWRMGESTTMYGLQDSEGRSFEAKTGRVQNELRTRN